MGFINQVSKMKVVYGLLSLLTTTDAFIETGYCSVSDFGKETVKESWSCNTNGASCKLEKTTCGCDGVSTTEGGTHNFDSRGNAVDAVGSGWNCYSKCQGNRRTQGAQTKYSTKSCRGGDSFGSSGGNSFGNGGSGSRDCDYSCTSGGGCEARLGGTMGSCFSQRFGGACSGTPRDCYDCNQVINCWYSLNEKIMRHPLF